MSLEDFIITGYCLVDEELKEVLVVYITVLLYNLHMNCKELMRWLKKQGCIFDECRGKGSHITVRYGSKVTVMPLHGSKELPIGTVMAIKKQLGLK